MMIYSRDYLPDKSDKLQSLSVLVAGTLPFVKINANCNEKTSADVCQLKGLTT